MLILTIRGFNKMEPQLTLQEHQWQPYGSFIGNRVISRFGDNSLAPKVTWLVGVWFFFFFFLWGHLKTKMYITRPTTLYELKTRTLEKIASIPREVLQRVVQNYPHTIPRMCTEERTLFRRYFFRSWDYCFCFLFRFYLLPNGVLITLLFRNKIWKKKILFFF